MHPCRTRSLRARSWRNADLAIYLGKDGKSAQESMVDSVNAAKTKIFETMTGK